MNLNPEVVLRLTVPQVNQLLAIVAKEPLAQVIDLFSAIKSQGDMALILLQAEPDLSSKVVGNGAAIPAAANADLAETASG